MSKHRFEIKIERDLVGRGAMWQWSIRDASGLRERGVTFTRRGAHSAAKYAARQLARGTRPPLVTYDYEVEL